MIGEAERSKLQVGYKQAVRALNENAAAKVFLSEDCDGHIKNSIADLCGRNDTPVLYVSSMKELGSMCGIDIGASCAVILK